MLVDNRSLQEKDNIKLLKKGLEPEDQLSRRINEGHVFGLDVGTGNGELLVRAARDQIGAKKNVEAASGTAVIRTSSPINI